MYVRQLPHRAEVTKGRIMQVRQAAMQMGIDPPVRREAMPAISLRPYQEDAITATLDQYKNGTRRTMIVLATGGGKTVIAAALVDRMKQLPDVIAAGGRVLFLAHRDELIFQTVEKMKMVLGRDIDIGIVKAERNEYDADIVVASIQTVQNDKRLSQLGGFGFVISDEAHHSTSESWRNVLTGLGVFEDDGPYLFGMTATPDRTDGTGLSHVFHSIAYERGIFDMIKDGYLVDIVAKEVLIDVDFSKIKTTAGEYNAGSAGRALMQSHAPQVIAKAMKEHAPDRKSLVFVPTVEVARAAADEINAQGIPAKMLYAGTPADERRQMIDDLHRGKIMAIANCAVLTEGTDIPTVDCIVMARPTKSRSLYTQCVGRGLRIHPGKETALILDLVGAASKHRLQTVATLFGIAPKKLKAKTVVEALTDPDPIPEENYDGEVVVRDVSVPGRTMHWVTTANGQYVMSAPPGLVILRFGGMTPLGEASWEVWYVDQHKVPTRRYSGLPLDYAQGAAEDMVREMGVSKGPLTDPDAPWRSQPITEAQQRRCYVMRIPTGGLRSKGDASDAMNAAEAMSILQGMDRAPDKRLWKK